MYPQITLTFAQHTPLPTYGVRSYVTAGFFLIIISLAHIKNFKHPPPPPPPRRCVRLASKTTKFVCAPFKCMLSHIVLGKRGAHAL